MATDKSGLFGFKITQRQCFVIACLMVMVALYIKFLRPQLEPFSLDKFKSLDKFLS